MDCKPHLTWQIIKGLLCMYALNKHVRTIVKILMNYICISIRYSYKLYNHSHAVDAASALITDTHIIKNHTVCTLLYHTYIICMYVCTYCTCTLVRASRIACNMQCILYYCTVHLTI
jgi:ABC-type uncharacterized transport system permease subunit